MRAMSWFLFTMVVLFIAQMYWLTRSVLRRKRPAQADQDKPEPELPKKITVLDPYFLHVVRDPIRLGLRLTTNDGTQYLLLSYLEWRAWPSCREVSLTIGPASD